MKGKPPAFPPPRLPNIDYPIPPPPNPAGPSAPPAPPKNILNISVGSIFIPALLKSAPPVGSFGSDPKSNYCLFFLSDNTEYASAICLNLISASF